MTIHSRKKLLHSPFKCGDVVTIKEIKYKDYCSGGCAIVLEGDPPGTFGRSPFQFIPHDEKVEWVKYPQYDHDDVLRCIEEVQRARGYPYL